MVIPSGRSAKVRYVPGTAVRVAAGVCAGAGGTVVIIGTPLVVRDVVHPAQQSMAARIATVTMGKKCLSVFMMFTVSGMNGCWILE